MATSAQVQQLYIALLGRAADKPGLDWWLENINGTEGVPGERTLEQAAAAFTTSEEFLSTYGSLQGAELVTAVYNNLFERTPSQDEVNYWVNDGRPADELLQAFLTYASPADQAVIDNKVTVAQAYTEAAGSEIDLDAAAAIIADVDGTVESVDAALAQIGEEPGVPGDTFSLTAAADILNGTANDDTFVAASGTLGALDVINGGDGTDTLRVENAAELANGAEISGVEVIEVIGATTATLNASTLAEGIEALSFTRVADSAAANLTVNALAEAQTVSVAQRDVNGNGSFDNAVTVNANIQTGTGTTANLAVGGADVIYNAATASGTTGVETVNIAVSGSTGSTVTFGTGGEYDQTNSVVVTGAGDLELDVADLGSAAAGTAADPVAVIDASAATGNIELTVGGTAQVSSITLGSGDDTLVASGLDFDDTDLVLNGGAGNDTLVATAGQLTSLGTVGGANISGFETLGVGTTGQTINASVLAQLGFSAIELDGDLASATTVNNLAAGSNIVTLQDDADVTLGLASAAGSSDAVGVTVRDGSTSTITVGAGIETLNIVTADTDAETGTAFDVAALTLAGTDLESVVVSGDEAVSFDASSLGLDSIDLSGITSASSQADGNFAADVSVGSATAIGSAGDDRITFGLNADVTGGAGNDTFVAGYATAETATTFATITDFQAGDVIDFGAAVTGVEETTLTLAPGATATFQDYLDAAANTTAGQVNYFQFAGNTYVVQDADGTTSATFGAADTLIELTGAVDLSGLTANSTTVEFA